MIHLLMLKFSDFYFRKIKRIKNDALLNWKVLERDQITTPNKMIKKKKLFETKNKGVFYWVQLKEAEAITTDLISVPIFMCGHELLVTNTNLWSSPGWSVHVGRHSGEISISIDLYRLAWEFPGGVGGWSEELRMLKSFLSVNYFI